MNTRVFPLLVGSIGLSLLSGCTPAIVGEWNLTKWQVDGETADLNYSYGGYNIRTTFTLEIDDDMEGSFDFEMELEGYGAYAGYSDSYSASGDVEWEVIKGATYDVKIDVEDGDKLKLECTVDGDEMECEGEGSDGNDYESEWERD